MSVEEFRKSKRAIEKLLTNGEKEIAAGRGFDLDEVLAEADVLLAGGSVQEPTKRRSQTDATATNRQPRRS